MGESRTVHFMDVLRQGRLLLMPVPCKTILGQNFLDVVFMYPTLNCRTIICGDVTITWLTVDGYIQHHCNYIITNIVREKNKYLLSKLFYNKYLNIYLKCKT